MVDAKPTYRCVVRSNTLGAETFWYESTHEAEAGFRRLHKAAKKHTKVDGVHRTVTLVKQVTVRRR